MANGRFISNDTAADKKVNELSDDTSRLAFTWLITFADVEGRTYGDPSVLRSMLFPRRQDITVEKMESYISEWALKDMVIWYKSQGDLWIYFPNFDKHQVGLRKDREAPSKIPPPPFDTINEETELLRSKSGLIPEQLPVKLIKDKLREVKADAAESPENVFRVYEQEIGVLTKTVSDELISLEEDCPPGWVPDAIREAAKQNKRSLAYVKGIIKRQLVEGRSENKKETIPKSTSLESNGYERVVVPAGWGQK